MTKKKNIRDLIKELDRANAECNVSKQVDCSYELAEAYRKDDDLDKAIPAFEKTILLAKQNRDKQHWCLSARALAEIYANQNDLTQATHYAEVYRNTAAEFCWTSEIQLSYHVTAYIHQVVWTLSGKKELLEKSREWATKSYKYLLEHGKMIDVNKEDVLRAGNTVVRLTTISLLLAQILSNLGRQKEAAQYVEKALKASRKSGDSNAIISTLQVYFDDYKADNKLDIAKEMMSEANKLKSKREKCLASIYMMKAYLWHSQDLVKARDECYGIVAHHWQDLEEEERNMVIENAITIWRLFKAEKDALNWEALSKASVNKSIIKTRYEKLGDFATDAGLYFLALRYYLKYEAHAESYKEKSSALEAVATTFLDCLKKCKHLVEKSNHGLSYVEKLIAMQTQNGKSTDASRELRFELLLASGISVEKARVELKNLSGICQKELETAQAVFTRFLNGVPEPNDEEMDIECCKCNRCPLDVPSDEKVLTLFQEEAKLFFKRNYKDKEGETELHKAARDGNVEKVRLMVSELGFNVNEKDNASWTPLHEATKAAIAEILLDNGAKVDPKSQFSLVSDGDTDSGGGCTPLMSACYYANLSMAELLLDRGASVTMKNDRGYTAVDFLKLAIANGGVSDEDIERARILVEKMENLQKSAGMQPRKEDPNSFPKRTSTTLTRKPRILTDADLGTSQSQHFEGKSTIRPSKRSSGGDIFVIPHVESDDEEEEQENRRNKRSSTSHQIDDLLYMEDEDNDDYFNISRRRSKRPRVVEINDEDDVPFIDGNFPDSLSNDQSQYLASDILLPTEATSSTFPSTSNFGFSPTLESLDRRPLQQTQNFSTRVVSPQPSALPPVSAKTKQIRLKITYQNPDGSPFLNADGQPQSSHLIIVNRSDNIASLSSHSKCLEVLSGRSHLWFVDGCDVDKEITIGELALEDGLFAIICQINQLSIQGEYQRIAEMTLEDVSQALTDLASTSEFDASNLVLRMKTLIEIDSALTLLRVSHPKVVKMRWAELGKLPPTSVCFASWSQRFINANFISLNACGLTNEQIEAFAKMDGPFSIRTLDLSYNIFSDGQFLSSFVSRLSQLKELDLRSSNISRSQEALASALSNIQSLEELELSHCNWVTSSIFQQIFEGCTSLTTLNCENDPIEEILLDIASGVNLKNLSLSLCPLSTSAVPQLIEWIQSSQVEEVDLSGVNLTLENLTELIQSRRGKTLPLRVLNEIERSVPGVDEIYDLFYSEYRENDDVRFRFSSEVNRKLLEYGKYAERGLF